MKTIQIRNIKFFTMKKITYVLFACLVLIGIASCSKKTESAHLSVQMTDAPANYDAVTIDLQSVEVISDTQGAVTLNTTAGIYNLLDLSNGISRLIATGDLNVGTVSQIRLILGTNNSVTIAGVVHPLSTPSASQSGLKLQVHQTFVAGVSYSILLDFDANQSIVIQGDGSYQLKPVIRTIDTAVTGSITGSVTPVGAIATVSAVSNGITYSSVTNASGAFLVAGLPAGTYTITVTPALPKLPVTLTGKVVVIGVSTNVGIVAL